VALSISFRLIAPRLEPLLYPVFEMLQLLNASQAYLIEL